MAAKFHEWLELTKRCSRLARRKGSYGDRWFKKAQEKMELTASCHKKIKLTKG
jgi:hypothetical protein